MASARLETEQQQRNRQILEAVRAKSALLLDLATCDFRTIDYDTGADIFPESTMRIVLELLKSDDFLRMDGSNYLVFLLLSQWSTISADQKCELLGAFEEAYPRFVDPLSCQIVSDILGRQFMNERATDLLARFSKDGTVVGRALAAVGLEIIARKATDANLRQRASDALASMCRDTDEQVRGEAERAIARLSVIKDRPNSGTL